MEAPQRKKGNNYDDDSNDSCSCGSYDCQGCKCKQQHGDGQVKLTTVHEQKKMAEMPSINFLKKDNDYENNVCKHQEGLEGYSCRLHDRNGIVW